MSEEKRKRKSFNEKVAEQIAPHILSYLDDWTADDATKAINEDLDLGKILQSHEERLSAFQLILTVTPFSDRIVKGMYEEKWLNWFLKGPLKEKRRDIYTRVVYNPKGAPYFKKQVRGILDTITGNNNGSEE